MRAEQFARQPPRLWRGEVRLCVSRRRPAHLAELAHQDREPLRTALGERVLRPAEQFQLRAARRTSARPNPKTQTRAHPRRDARRVGCVTLISSGRTNDDDKPGRFRAGAVTVVEDAKGGGGEATARVRRGCDRC